LNAAANAFKDDDEDDATIKLLTKALQLGLDAVKKYNPLLKLTACIY